MPISSHYPKRAKLIAGSSPGDTVLEYIKIQSRVGIHLEHKGREANNGAQDTSLALHTSPSLGGRASLSRRRSVVIVSRGIGLLRFLWLRFISLFRFLCPVGFFWLLGLVGR